MSILDRFVSKETDEQEKKTFHPIPYRRMSSELDASGKEAKALYPDDSKTVENFVWSLKDACRSRYKKALEGEMRPMRAEARFYLSPDRMCAFACILPPENDGDEITLEDFLSDLRYEGICFGVLEKEIPDEFNRGYLHIFPVARGKLPLEGEDGKVTELFQRRKNMRLEVQNGSQVDFGQDVQLQPIRRGTVICLIRSARAGTDGTDVTGQRLPCPEAKDAFVPQGENTLIGRRGQALLAGADGILYIENDRFCIHAQKIIDGNLDQFQGVLSISGNLYIEGNVDGGVDIVASGDIVINGQVGQARLKSQDGTIRIQQGIHGTEGKTLVIAAGQVQARVIEKAEIEAGTSVIAETITNSNIRCGGTVHAMTGRGMIVDCQIHAGDSVLCLRIGNLAGSRSRFSVGYPPQVLESWEATKAELAQIQPTLERLWDMITDLRRKGPRMTDHEKWVLEQLVEQRDLYMGKQESLKTELRALNKEINRKTKGKIRCEKLYPTLNVQIGRLEEEIITVEENCSIHAEDNHILLE